MSRPARLAPSCAAPSSSGAPVHAKLEPSRGLDSAGAASGLRFVTGTAVASRSSAGSGPAGPGASVEHYRPNRRLRLVHYPVLGFGDDLGRGETGRHHLNDVVAERLERPQKTRQHQGGGRLDVVKQKNALASALKPFERALHHFVCADMGPVIRQKVSAPDHDAT